MVSEENHSFSTKPNSQIPLYSSFDLLPWKIPILPQKISITAIHLIPDAIHAAPVTFPVKTPAPLSSHHRSTIQIITVGANP